MAMIRFLCMTCKERLAVPDRHAGRRGRCPACGVIIQIPKESLFEEPSAPMPAGTPGPPIGSKPFVPATPDGTTIALPGLTTVATAPTIVETAITFRPPVVAPPLSTAPAAAAGPATAIAPAITFPPPQPAVPPSPPKASPVLPRSELAGRWPAVAAPAPAKQEPPAPRPVTPEPVRPILLPAVAPALAPSKPAPEPPPPIDLLPDIPPGKLVAVNDDMDSAGWPVWMKVAFGIGVLGVLGGVLWLAGYLLILFMAQSLE